MPQSNALDLTFCLQSDKKTQSNIKKYLIFVQIARI